jgi:hypothetical protein
MDFYSHTWIKAKDNDADIVQAIRRDIRINRRERGRAGHRFRHSTLKNVWYVDLIHAVVNHTDDPVWQHYYNHPRDGWVLVNWHMTRREAQAAAEQPYVEQEVADRPDGPKGLYVIADWPGHDNGYPIKVHCSSPQIAGELKGVFESIGCRAMVGDDTPLVTPDGFVPLTYQGQPLVYTSFK